MDLDKVLEQVSEIEQGLQYIREYGHSLKVNDIPSDVETVNRNLRDASIKVDIVTDIVRGCYGL